MKTWGDFMMAVHGKVEEIGIKLSAKHYSESVINWQSEVKSGPSNCGGWCIYVRDQIKTNMGVVIEVKSESSSWGFKFIRLLRLAHHESDIFKKPCKNYFAESLDTPIYDSNRPKIEKFMAILDEAVRGAKAILEVCEYFGQRTLVEP